MPSDRSLKDPPPLTPAVLHILLALTDGPRHGYAIMQAVEETSGLAMGPGTIYGTVQRLEENGWLKEVPSTDDERRRVFALLPAGRRALQAEAERLSHLMALLRARRFLPKET